MDYKFSPIGGKTRWSISASEMVSDGVVRSFRVGELILHLDDGWSFTPDLGIRRYVLMGLLIAVRDFIAHCRDSGVGEATATEMTFSGDEKADEE